MKFGVPVILVVFLAVFLFLSVSLLSQGEMDANPPAMEPGGNETPDECLYCCQNGTHYGECSGDKPLYCQDGVLKHNCSVCGCDEGFECEDSGYCTEYRTECEDGTLNGSCSENRPFYCDKGELVERCEICGCYPYSVCYENGSCQYTKTGDNQPPAFANLEDKEVREGEILEFTVSGYDVEQDVLSYHVSALPEGAGFNRSSGKFRWAPGYEQAGSYEIIFTVSDGEFNVSKKVTVEVANVNRRPESVIHYPSGNQEFYAGEAVQFSGRGSGDADNDRLVYAWDFGDGSTGEGLTVNHTYVNPGTYNVTLEVNDSELSDTGFVVIKIRPVEEPILDDDRDGVENSKDRCPDTYMESVNVYGCPLPEYEKFKNNLTTDFTETDLIGASNVTIGIPEIGKIEFRKNVLNLTGKDLDAYVDIERMNVTVRTENLPELNKSAVITFYNVEIEDPVIVRDGIYCHDCRIISHVNKTFVFSVPHFTRYSLMAWASYSGYCGDMFCSIYESCYDCSMDCGECGEIRTPSECEEYWMCGPWSECSELDLKERECNDVNLCGTERYKPREVMECSEEAFPSLTLFGAIVFILASVYLIADHYKKKSELRKLSRYELHEVIRGYMYRGFTKPEIGKVLRSRGYKTEEIKELIKEVEKEVF